MRAWIRQGHFRCLATHFASKDACLLRPYFMFALDRRYGIVESTATVALGRDYTIYALKVGVQNGLGYRDVGLPRLSA